MNALADRFEHIQTERGRMEQYFLWEVYEKLSKWFGDYPHQWPEPWCGFYLGRGQRKDSILAALGRVEDDDLLVTLAQHIAMEKIRTADAVRLIRATRRRAKALERAAEQAGLGRLTWLEAVRLWHRDPEAGRAIEADVRRLGLVPTGE